MICNHIPMEILRKLGGFLQQCSMTESFNNGLSLHAFLIKLGFHNDLYICNHLINLYTKSHDFISAHKIFDTMNNHNLVSWSSLISGYNQARKHSVALRLFTKMKLQPNEFVYASILSACGSLSAIRQGRQVHAHSLITSHATISFVSNSLISMYMKCSCFGCAFSVFTSLSKPNSVSYNAIIKGLAENFQFGSSIEMFIAMKLNGLQTDRFTYAAVLESCTDVNDARLCATVHCDTIKVGLDSTTFVGNSILTMYSRCGTIVQVEKAFDSIAEKDAITFNTYITCCLNCGEHTKVFSFFKRMESSFGVLPDNYTFACVLSVCAELASIRYGEQIHARLIRKEISRDVGLNNAIINMYAKCGLIQNANFVFNNMLEKNLVSWNTMLVALGSHGFGKIAIDTFDRMRADNIMPDDVTFVALLSACSHSGLVDEGLAYFDSIEEIYRITPKVEHLSCLVDLLGRAGRLEEAENYIKKSGYDNDVVIWGSLLSSSKIHNHVSIAQRAATKLLALEVNTSSPYVLMSNLYASEKRWEEVSKVRKLLKGGGVKKEPGHSMITVDNLAEYFTVGGFSHARDLKLQRH